MEADKYYHIFNRTNNKEFLFKEEENYRFFLEQVKKYIVPIADIFSYCLMPNHFHFVLRIKGDNKLKVFVEKSLKINQIKDLQGFENLEGLTSKFISQQFSNLFNSYTKAINKKYNRKGSLFTPRFKRKEINAEEYLKQVIIYVHLNPVHHRVSSGFEIFPHSSYRSIISNKATLIARNEIIELFDDLKNFKFSHQIKNVNENLLTEIIDDDDS